MSPTTKRKTEAESSPEISKKQRQEEEEGEEEMTTNPLPDSQIDHAAAIAYWSSTPATVSGVLGGYPQVSRVDLQGSANFFGKLRRTSKHFPKTSGKLTRAVDCGAGVGRITKGLLSEIAQVVDIVEPVKSFTDEVKDEGCVGKIYNVGLEGWKPEYTYDLIWNQWCVGQLTDVQLVAYLKTLPAFLNEGGWIIVKENMSNHHLGEDVFDPDDSSVTRTDVKFRKIFEDAGLKLLATEVQKRFPKDLYPVRAYALQPK
ncbi:related to putative methyltransferase [Ramularia collo-cygni]|uniref:Alpha N-terminal protein methyltransferase 1 n=1 Tax=Ramularia collo-cygni TaxID=112498 RepID=A0A2D3VAI3_9PEZI|nr:related to putative methyltransferase [Ramularia collo-cygni]CZT22635.1 related to putative methyltransferase [Ramularia collo-cygni]